MANFNSTQYANSVVNKYVSSVGAAGGQPVAIPIEHVTTTDANGDTVNACVLPANWKAIGLHLSTADGLGTSVTVAVGDAGSATRFAAATAMAAATNAITALAAGGQNYSATTDTIVLLTYGGASPTTARNVKGYLLCLPTQS